MKFDLYAITDWKSAAEKTAIKSSWWLQQWEFQVSLVFMTY